MHNAWIRWCLLNDYTKRMEIESWLVFIAAIFVGSYVQSVIGFAMGMIVVAIGGLTASVAFTTLTAAVSLITLVNIIMALRGNLRFVSRRFLFYLVLGQLPAIAAGLYVLDHLTADALSVLELLLALFLVCGSIAMVYRPNPIAKVSGPVALFFAGMAAGITGGLFAASGPVMGWFAYRQPLELKIIRATLLSFFAVACISRTLMVAYGGGITEEVIRLFLASIPAVVLGAWLGVMTKPNVADALLKRVVFIAILVMGAYIGIRAAYQFTH